MNEKQPISMTLDGIRFQLLEAHDFSWLRQMGKVTHVFDRQDSGHISFGIATSLGQRFLKYAGARPVNYRGEPEDAIITLKQAISNFDVLRHPALVDLCQHFPVGDGYVAVFGWFDGIVLSSPDYPAPEKYSDPRSPYYRFRQLSVARRLDCLDQIFRFHEHVEQQGYVAIDLYDGSILYDFERHLTRICDIDCYQPRPFVNYMGRLWGSSRFMSPEEFQLGAEIDERTNVFNMGAMAFCLVGGDRDRSYDKWEPGEALYQVAFRAITPDRNKRHASVTEFRRQWSDARERCCPKRRAADEDRSTSC